MFRTYKRLASAACAASLAATFFVSSSAVAAPQQGKVFGDWIVDCETRQDDHTQKCFVSQTQTTKDGKGRLLKFSVGHLGAKGETVAVAILPLGIYLPAGAAFKIDQGPQVSMVLQACTAEGCAAGIALDDKTLAAALAGKTLAIGFIPAGSRQTVSVAVSLKGFRPAFASLK
jgi:invasion protein IalB